MASEGIDWRTDQLSLRMTSMRAALERARDTLPRLAELDAQLAERLNRRFSLLTEDFEERAARALDGEAVTLLAEGEELIGETVAVLGGAAARHYRVDEGLTSIALAWLDWLSDRQDLPRVTAVVPAIGELTGMVTRVVRLRVPFDGIWGLPVAVHEYGHFLAAVRDETTYSGGVPKRKLPVEEALYAESEKPLNYRHGHELWADMVASFVAGPAYTDYCLRYRFDPATADLPSATHPPTARRMRVQFTVLERLAKEDKSGYLQGELARLRQSWADALKAAGSTGAIQADDVLDELERVLDAFAADCLRPIQYGHHARANALSEARLDECGDDLTATHILNAAWIARRSGSLTTSEVARKATKLLHEVLGIA